MHSCVISASTVPETLTPLRFHGLDQQLGARALDRRAAVRFGKRRALFASASIDDRHALLRQAGDIGHRRKPGSRVQLVFIDASLHSD